MSSDTTLLFPSIRRFDRQHDALSQRRRGFSQGDCQSPSFSKALGSRKRIFGHSIGGVSKRRKKQHLADKKNSMIFERVQACRRSFYTASPMMALSCFGNPSSIKAQTPVPTQLSIGILRRISSTIVYINLYAPRQNDPRIAVSKRSDPKK